MTHPTMTNKPAFRFPRAAIFLMLVTLLGTIIAIERWVGQRRCNFPVQPVRGHPGLSLACSYQCLCSRASVQELVTSFST